MKNVYKIALVVIALLSVIPGCELNIETFEVYDDRNQFIGSYEIEEYSEGSSATFYYDIHISKSRNQNGVIWIGNFYDADISVFGEVDFDRFYIPVQRIGNLEFEGRGTIFAGEELSISYTVREIRPGPDYVDFMNCVGWKNF